METDFSRLFDPKLRLNPHHIAYLLMSYRERFNAPHYSGNDQLLVDGLLGYMRQHPRSARIELVYGRDGICDGLLGCERDDCEFVFMDCEIGEDLGLETLSGDDWFTWRDLTERYHELMERLKCVSI